MQRTPGAVSIPRGNAAFPGLRFDYDPKTGIYSPATSELAVITNGTAKWGWNSSGDYIPVLDNAYSIGSSAFAVKDLYMNGFITTDDLTSKATDPTSYGTTASFTGSTTNPTGTKWAAQYFRLGRLITVFIETGFGAGAISAGSGSYTFAIPVNMDTTIHPTNAVLGSGGATLVATNFAFVVRANNASTIRLTSTPSGTMNATNPGTWASNDSIWAAFQYVAA